MSDDGMMSAREYNELKGLLRRREQVAKLKAKQRSKELMAEVERELAARYKVDDERWADVVAIAAEAVARADAEIAQRCRELGIREDFRPALDLRWAGRGENAYKSVRDELRRVAESRIAALEAEAVAAIEEQGVEVQSRLVAGSLGSASAVAFLDAMPGPEQLMPVPSLDDLETGRKLLQPEGGSWRADYYQGLRSGWNPPEPKALTSGSDD